MEITFNQSAFPIEVPSEVEAEALAAASPMMDASELSHLAAAIVSAASPPRAIIVEIGAFRGETTVFIARVLKRLGLRHPVLSIDPFERADPDPLNPQGSYSAYMQNLRSSGVDDVCAPLVAFSERAAPLVPDSVGLLVIDG